MDMECYEATLRRKEPGQKSLNEEVIPRFFKESDTEILKPLFKKFDIVVMESIGKVNTRLFCKELTSYLKNKTPNVKIMFNTEVASFVRSKDKRTIRAIKTLKGEEIVADVFVIAAGADVT